MFILDASGSMNDRMNGSSRMKIAIEQMERFIKNLPSDTEAGLVAYGNRIPGCDSARLYSPLKRGGARDIVAKLPLFFPAGSTPIARTLELVSKHLLTGHPNTEIVLISDGVESCDGDPAKEIQKIRLTNPNVKVHVLGLDVLPNEERDLHYLAGVGDGKYFPIKSKQSMENALTSIWTREPIKEVNDPNLPIFPDPSAPKKEPYRAKPESNPKPPVDISPSNDSIPYIKITNLEKTKTAKGESEFLVWYEYEGNKEDSEYTAMLLFYPDSGKDASQIPNLREKKAPAISQSVSVDHSQRKGKGYIRIRMPETNQIRVGAELWETNSIPKSVAVASSKNLSDAKSTETFDQIFR
ncbi:vWA domain-containing protein [Leptospira sp. GIMC2001]|uniref:vWA domain-containing protein n=1 Tax=Leptospira sp. GIMC2001 TaxID=1513297 RepID=UPI00234B4093|nr:VWA domain-containing protein [Leptospira sp. GIMC2001]WCL51284.1 VWA domain-containing protein [Leptospira sp. GIMC2001]